MTDYIHPDLVRRLADEASTLEVRVSRSVVAATDYRPPVDLKLVDVLRAVLVTDTMLFGKANQGYRLLLIQAFHHRGSSRADRGSSPPKR